MPNIIAPEGKVFVCMACGKRSRDKYGDKALNKGWDVSCMMNSDLIDEDRLVVDDVTDRVTMVK